MKISQYFEKRAKTKDPQESTRVVEDIKLRILKTIAIAILPAIALVAGNEFRKTVEESPISFTQQGIDTVDTVDTIDTVDSKTVDNNPEKTQSLSYEELEKLNKELEVIVDAGLTFTPGTEQNTKAQDTNNTAIDPHKLIDGSRKAVDTITNMGIKGYEKAQNVGKKVKESEFGKGASQAGKGVAKAGTAAGKAAINLGKAGIDKTSEGLIKAKAKLTSAFNLFGKNRKDKNTEKIIM